ncbi:DUF4760 domain-containing protein [Acidobacteria bacterium AH-259-L09]|nr:DUF4760 domain-containing protein [Acidobacteria bacterium AH-259-L09]
MKLFRSKVKDADKPISQFVEIRFPVNYSVALGIAVVILTLAYWYFDYSKTVQFLAIAAGVAAGILSAIYVGRGLASAAAQRQAEVEARRVAGAFDFARRWNDPRLEEIRKTYGFARRSAKGKAPDQIDQILEKQVDLKEAVLAVLNFFEEMSIAVSTKTADEETLKRFFKTMVLICYNTLSPWITDRRRRLNRPRIWQDFEKLFDRWK